MKAKNKTEHFCGNCDSHNSFNYPTQVFCSTRHAQNLDPIVDTLWRCDQWNLVSQECYCVREAKRAKASAAKRR